MTDKMEKYQRNSKILKMYERGSTNDGVMA